ncbi:hypothetical protein CLAVI_000801 [Candidatus Clavichlamydia salmonicola]|uniref:hypothetical protein n=1 Tax=Candidatus Clavichlamydia salmonicola TaxID=469812 RepID=UPI0018910956|nr:hypothetical protein [Candidatus Clavichlamydia salmonicola]MBF5051165.1 hypothetical protein [Candidatus Clavichlamydia salmonicola]
MNKPFVKITFNNLHKTYLEELKVARTSPYLIIEKTSLGYLPLSGGVMKGPINMGETKENKGFAINGLTDPTNATDAVNLRFLRENCVGIWGGLVTKNLSMGYLATVTGLPNPADPSDAVNLQTLNAKLELITAESVKALPLQGGLMQGALNMQGYLCTGIAIPVNESDAVPLSYLKKYALSIWGGNVMGTLYLNKNRIRGLADPLCDDDAVNFKTVKNLYISKDAFDGIFLSTKGGIITGDLHVTGKLSLNFNPLSLVGDPIEQNDAINLGFAELNYISRRGGLLQGDLSLENKWKIKNLSNPEDPFDAVNLNTLLQHIHMINPVSQSEAVNFLRITGGIMEGSLDMNKKYLLTGLMPPSNPTDAVSLEFLQKSYISIHGGYLMGSLLMKGTSTITGLPSPVNPKDAISLEYANLNYFPLKGGSLMGNLDLMGNSLTGIPSPKKKNDAVNLQTLENTITKKIEEATTPMLTQIESTSINLKKITGIVTSLDSSLNINGGTMQGSISMNNTHYFTDLPDPIEGTQAINLRSVVELLHHYLPLKGTFLNENIDLKNTATITGLTDPVNDTDAVNLRTLTTAYTALYEENLYNENRHLHTVIKAAIENGSIVHLDLLDAQLASFFEKLQETFLSLKGGSLSGDLNMSGPKFYAGYSVKGLADPVDDRDAVNKQTLQRELEAFAIPRNALSKNGGSLLGILDMSSNRITRLADPINDADAVNQQTLKRNLINYLPVEGGNVQGPLNLNKNLISSIKDPVDDYDAVNLQTLNKSLANMLSINGGQMNGSLNMNAHILTGLSDPANDLDAVNFRTIKNLLKDLLNTTNILVANIEPKCPAPVGPLDMANNLLTGLPLAVNDTDAVSKAYLNTCGILEAFLIKPMTEITSLLWNNSTKISWNRFGDDMESSPNAFRYFQVGGVNGSALLLYREKLYSINISVLTETSLSPGCKLSLYINRGLSSYKIGANNPESGTSFNINSSWPINERTQKGSDHFFLVYSGNFPLMTEGFFWSIFAYGIPF